MQIQEVVEAQGHLIDSQILNVVFDTVVKHGASFDVLKFNIGRSNDEPSSISMRISAASGPTLGEVLEELVALGRTHHVPVMEDLGAGALIDLSLYGLPKEPVVAERVAKGADVVTFSGDKLLGGPQAGLIVGRKEGITRIKQNPLKRALRPGKLTLAALSATLRLYRRSPELVAELPTLRWLTRPRAEMDAIAAQALPLLQEALEKGETVERQGALAALALLAGAPVDQTLAGQFDHGWPVGDLPGGWIAEHHAAIIFAAGRLRENHQEVAAAKRGRCAAGAVVALDSPAPDGFVGRGRCRGAQQEREDEPNGSFHELCLLPPHWRANGVWSGPELHRGSSIFCFDQIVGTWVCAR